MQTCKNCQFWRFQSAKTLPDGRCYRYPRTTRAENWHWCGEHQPKENTDATSD